MMKEISPFGSAAVPTLSRGGLLAVVRRGRCGHPALPASVYPVSPSWRVQCVVQHLASRRHPNTSLLGRAGGLPYIYELAQLSTLRVNNLAARAASSSLEFKRLPCLTRPQSGSAECRRSDCLLCSVRSQLTSRTIRVGCCPARTPRMTSMLASRPPPRKICVSGPVCQTTADTITVSRYGVSAPLPTLRLATPLS